MSSHINLGCKVTDSDPVVQESYGPVVQPHEQAFRGLAQDYSYQGQATSMPESSGPEVHASRGPAFQHPAPDAHEPSGPAASGPAASGPSFSGPGVSEDLLGLFAGGASSAAGAAQAGDDDDDYLPPPPLGPIPKKSLEAAGMDASNLQLVI